MALFDLPAHKLEMDEPAPSQVFQYNGETMYRWIMSNTEKAHIADMLSMDVADLTVTGSTFLQDRMQCSGCGKHSGFDDFVHNALYAGIHSVDFMKNFILTDGSSKAPLTEHELTCSRCIKKHDGRPSWRAYPPWTD